MLARLVLAAVATLLTLFACEGALRVGTGPLFPEGQPTFLPWMALDPVFGWRNIAGAPVGPIERSDGARLKRRINRLGLRGEEITREKPAGSVRIVCLGDSVTFGVIQPDVPGESDRHTPTVSYVDELARLVEQRGPQNVQVINAGVVGYSSSHGLRQLALQVLDLDPDVVTFRFGVNDQYDSWAPARRAMEPRASGRTLLYALHDWKLFRAGLSAYQRLPGLHPRADSVPWTDDERFRRNAERFVELTQQHGVHLLFMDFPVGALGRIDPAFGTEGAARTFHRRIFVNTRRLQRIAQEVAERNGVPIVYTAGPKAPRTAPLFNGIDYVHPTVEGASFIAERLYAELGALGWLSPPSPD
ncbi:MAG: SGNH/GDSL hydrolase family protein [Deltaproteobacteria bacterium]|nr:SGNH/GDSL hydrolase family protein [Deltaproteobacteria bacterium]